MSAHFNADPKLYEKIQQLIAEGNTTDALLQLFENGYDTAIGLKTRFEEAKEQFESKRIDFAAWSRMLNQVNYIILELLFPDKEETGLNDLKERMKVADEKPAGPVPKAKLFALLNQHKTAEAIELCVNLGSGQTLLKARFNTAAQYFRTGRITEKEWTEVEVHTHCAIQELVKKAPDGELVIAQAPEAIKYDHAPQEKAPKNLLKKIQELLRY